MPLLKRQDGVELYWEERGEGPLVVFATQFFGAPTVFEGLVAELAADHRVITYDTRGTGRSTRTGPYEVATDAADLTALLETAGGPAAVIAMGDGANRALRVAVERPELVTAIVTPGGNPVGREAAQGTDALVDSPSVLEALIGMIDTDYRAALRTMVSGANPSMTEEEARERVDSVVEYCSQEVGAARLRSWIDADARPDALAVGDRLWILALAEETNPWFNPPTRDRTRELLPEARIEVIEGGAISRPQDTAAVVRRITAGLRTGRETSVSP